MASLISVVKRPPLAGSPRFSISRRREAIEGYLFISPWFIGFLVFTAGPMLASLGLGFSKWGLIDRPIFTGLENYVAMAKDPIFWHSLLITARFTLVSVPLRIILALAVALLLIRPLRGVYWMRAVYYLPAVIGGVVVGLLWMWVFNPDYGILNFALALIGVSGPKWLVDPKWSLWAIIIMSLWNLGGPMILFLAGLQSISPHFYEAAKLDGANAWHELRYVTLPMLSPTLLFVLINQIISSFQVFDVVFIASQGTGGPIRSTLVYLLYFYQNGFQYFKMGYASALAWVLLIIIMILTVLVFKSSSAWVFYEGEVKR